MLVANSMHNNVVPFNLPLTWVTDHTNIIFSVIKTKTSQREYETLYFAVPIPLCVPRSSPEHSLVPQGGAGYKTLLK